jgi:6-phosphogluconolactonase
VNVADAYVGLTGIYQGHRRMTLTYPILNQARQILWVVTGNDKRATLDRLRKRHPLMPGGRINAERALVLADSAAAGSAKP